MKIYLASFLESENFGPGRIIGIANGNKPKYIDVELVFPPFIPTNELMDEYNKTSNKSKAGEIFEKDFAQQLNDFVEKVKKTAKEEGKEPADILPFIEGDTLASWEREQNTNYRKAVGKALIKLGYDIVLK